MKGRTHRRPPRRSDQLRDRRMLVLFFDLTSMRPDDLIRAHDAAEKFLKKQMTKADLVAVVAFSTQAYRAGEFHERSRRCWTKRSRN